MIKFSVSKLLKEEICEILRLTILCLFTGHVLVMRNIFAALALLTQGEEGEISITPK